MPTTLHHEVLALTRLAAVASVADRTSVRNRGLEIPIEHDIISALNSSPTLAAALGFEPAARWLHGPNLHADVIGETVDRPTVAEVKIWSNENENNHGGQFDVIRRTAPDGADLVVITRTGRMSELETSLAGTPWRVMTMAQVAAACEERLRSPHLAGVASELTGLWHQAIRELGLKSARLNA